jgi:hypothetical protein
MAGSLYAGESRGGNVAETHKAIGTIITRSDLPIQQCVIYEVTTAHRPKGPTQRSLGARRE